MIICTGIGTTIMDAVKELRSEEQVFRIRKRSDEVYDFTDCPPDVRIILAGGYLAGKSDAEHTAESMDMTITANYLEPIQIIDQALDELPAARICVIGSQSAAAGSYDTQYAFAKARLHRFVMRRPGIHPQQVVAVAPPIIADSGMTRRRHDYPRVLRERPHCMAIDVARVIVNLLWERPVVLNETTGCVVPIHPTVLPGVVA